MKKSLVAAAALVLAAVPIGAVTPAAAPATPAVGGTSTRAVTGTQEYVVLFAAGASAASARAAIRSAGGRVVSVNTAVGVATVRTTSARFAAAAAKQPALAGVARNRIIGDVPSDVATAEQVHKLDPAALPRVPLRGTGSRSGSQGGRATGHSGGGPGAAEPLAARQWDMRQIGATPSGSYRYERGDRRVTVGIIDTGVDGSHPDIAPNFDAALSRNFTVDIPVDANGDSIDGPCADEPDQSCQDPSDVDEDGHGTHVASTIASPINGLGIAGVAPDVRIVNLRAGQDSGYFFLQPSVDALTYAGQHGIDVVNMSYYVDPWLFNCSSNPADSPADQAEQRVIVTAMQRALDYARQRGVTLVAAAGNGATDYTEPLTDASSPDFASVPGEAAYVRDLVDPAACTSMPSEGKGVISVSSTGPSTRKAYYSDYGNGYVDVAAPGGDAYDTPTNNRDIQGLVLAAYPESLAIANGDVDENGEPTTDAVVRSCDGSVCAYYQYLQGTSMASPHAAGVAALIVSRYGFRDFRNPGLTLPSLLVEGILRASATRTACPVPATYHYTRILLSGAVVESDATCEGSRWSNGFYGNGIVSALHAIGR